MIAIRETDKRFYFHTGFYRDAYKRRWIAVDRRDVSKGNSVGWWIIDKIGFDEGESFTDEERANG